jgi:pyruvate dehydrogenase E1 component alpha subunit
MTDVETAPLLVDPVLADTLMVDLLFARRLSERMWNLQRQGRLTTVAPLAGQEAAVAGVVRGMDLATDWFVPYYRDATGYGPLGDEFVEQLIVYWRGHPDGGRIPDGVRSLPVQISLGTQLPHAAGLAWGLRLRGDPGVVCTFIGDGATSEGDFYEAMNLAGVQKVPLVIACINNGWAISTPTSEQTAAESFAAKGAAAGIRGERIDGNDVLAVLAATRDARRRAAAGEGPTLIELVTYRMGAHTNSDDPTRYVPEAELAEWRARDPIERYRSELRRSGLWDDERHDAAVAEVEARLEAIIERALAREVDPASALDHVDGVPSARNRAQRADIVARSTPASAPQDDDDDATAASAPQHDDGATAGNGASNGASNGDASGGVSWRA